MIVSTLAGLGHPLRCLLKIAGLARSTYYYLLSHPEPVTRPDIEPMVAEVFHRTPNGCGHRPIVLLQCLFDRFGSVFPQCGLMVFPGVVIVSR